MECGGKRGVGHVHDTSGVGSTSATPLWQPCALTSADNVSNARRRSLLPWALLGFLLAVAPLPAVAREYHVAATGDDTEQGTVAAPLRTIQRAADLAQPGDVITVHEGVYREEIDPPRGGTSDERRIVYQAAPGEHVEILGSEVVRNWSLLSNDVWNTTIPNSLFGDFNPFADEVSGDWFNPRGRMHHTGCVYLDGEGLFEAAARADLFDAGAGSGQPFINMASFSVNGTEVPAVGFMEAENLKPAESTEPSGSCIGWIYSGSWARYAGVDFGSGTDRIDLRLAIPSREATVEIRLDSATGTRIGVCYPSPTGDWQTWKTFSTSVQELRGRHTLCIVFREPTRRSWFAEVGEDTTAVWANFGGDDPNEGLTEVNVRQTVFYPRRPFVNYLTVRGFKMRHAAPKWAPPTAEQMGLIGTHWSKGWIIEDNEISHSVNTGITLGKYGDEYDNAGATAQAYLDSIDRARSNGWNRATIGSHIVRNNEISWCEQAGMVGSMGACFSEITGNHIHHIFTQRRFSGAEMAGIKFHAPIDMLIEGNRIHDAFQGIWLDWMTQGTRVTRNLLYRNDLDLFLEVNHGPFLIDNNLFLSRLVKHHSQGGAYVHNVFASVFGAVTDQRHTPYFKAHSTEKVADHVLNVGDDRFYNNVFVGRDGSHIDPGWWEGMKRHPDWRFGHGLWIYEGRPQPPQTGGNVYCYGAKPYPEEVAAVIAASPDLKVDERGGEVFLNITVAPEQLEVETPLVTSELLGVAHVPQLPFQTPGGEPVVVDGDYFGTLRDPGKAAAGPFAHLSSGVHLIKVWPNQPR